ncbi:MAG: hypothetical protein AB7O66_03855 [Limisphaerales bacterium]
MNPRDFDTTTQPPTLAARLKPEEAARLIGCQPHDIPILVRIGLLKPLGRPPVNAVKYFSRQRVLDLCSKDAWLVQVSDALVQHWQGKNRRRSNPSSSVLPAGRRPRCPSVPRHPTRDAEPEIDDRSTRNGPPGPDMQPPEGSRSR